MSKQNPDDHLKAIEGSSLTQILISETAVRLEFSGEDLSYSSSFFLKTANFVSNTPSPSSDYQSEMCSVIPTLYLCIGQKIASVILSEKRAELKFTNGQTVWICDMEDLWDNLFAIQQFNDESSIEWLYNSTRA
jgi:hypothetical protein